MNASWTSFATVSHPYMQNNLYALQTTQPALAPILLTHRNRSDIGVRLAGPNVWACQYEDARGEWIVHGQGPPQEETAPFLRSVLQAFQNGAWLALIVGGGMGPWISSCAASLEQKHRGEPKGLLVLEQDPGLLCAGLALYDFSAAIQSGRILFGLGPNLVQQVKELYEAHHFETLDWSQVFVEPGYKITDPQRLADYQYLNENIRTLHQEQRAGYFELLHQAETYWSNPAPDVQKVWTHVTDDRAAGGILLGLAEGFRKAGLESRAFRLTDKLFTRFYRCAYDFFTFLPDLILCINHSSEYVAAFATEVPIPRVVWYVDHPANTVEVPYHSQDRVVGVAENFADEVRRRGGKWLGTLPAPCLPTRENAFTRT